MAAQTSSIDDISLENFVALQEYFNPQAIKYSDNFGGNGVIYYTNPGIKKITLTYYEPVRRFGELSKGDRNGTTICTYDNKGRLIELIAEGFHHRIKYEGNNIVDIRKYDSNSGYELAKKTYSYNGNTITITGHDRGPLSYSYYYNGGKYRYESTPNKYIATYSGTEVSKGNGYYLCREYSIVNKTKQEQNSYSHYYLFILGAFRKTLFNSETVYSYVIDGYDKINQMTIYEGNIQNERTKCIIDYKYEIEERAIVQKSAGQQSIAQNRGEQKQLEDMKKTVEGRLDALQKLNELANYRNSGVDNGATINGVHWATRNVDNPGTFAAKPHAYGKFYSWEQAQTACPAGWRLPTKAEFQSLINAGSYWIALNGINGRIFGNGNNTIFLPASGAHDSMGELYEQNITGNYWHSTQYDLDVASYIGFYSDNIHLGDASPPGEHCVRCVAE